MSDLEDYYKPDVVGELDIDSRGTLMLWYVLRIFLGRR